MTEQQSHNFIVGTLTKKIDLFSKFRESLFANHPYFKHKDLIVIDNTDLGLKLVQQYQYGSHIWIPAINPWSFSENANLLIEAALLLKKDLMLCNDDTLFHTVNGIHYLSTLSDFYQEIGVISPMFRVGVGNEKQMLVKGTYESRNEPHYEDSNIMFVAVYLPYRAIKKVGYFDEVYDHTSYGWEDTDYCNRIREAGFKVCLTRKVEMSHGSLTKKSSCTFSELPDYQRLVEKGKFIYKQEQERKKRWGIS